MNHYKTISEGSHSPITTAPVHRCFEDIDATQLTSILKHMLSQTTPISSLIQALTKSPSETVLVDYLCSETKTASITDLTIQLALLSESLCIALDIDPVARASERDPYLQLIVVSGPDVGFHQSRAHKKKDQVQKEGDSQQEGITLTLNSFLFNALQELRTEASNGYRTVKDIPGS